VNTPSMEPNDTNSLRDNFKSLSGGSSHETTRQTTLGIKLDPGLLLKAINAIQASCNMSVLGHVARRLEKSGGGTEQDRLALTKGYVTRIICGAFSALDLPMSVCPVVADQRNTYVGHRMADNLSGLLPAVREVSAHQTILRDCPERNVRTVADKVEDLISKPHSEQFSARTTADVMQELEGERSALLVMMNQASEALWERDKTLYVQGINLRKILPSLDVCVLQKFRIAETRRTIDSIVAGDGEAAATPICVDSPFLLRRLVGAITDFNHIIETVRSQSNQSEEAKRQLCDAAKQVLRHNLSLITKSLFRDELIVDKVLRSTGASASAETTAEQVYTDLCSAIALLRMMNAETLLPEDNSEQGKLFDDFSRLLASASGSTEADIPRAAAKPWPIAERLGRWLGFDQHSDVSARWLIEESFQDPDFLRCRPDVIGPRQIVAQLNNRELFRAEWIKGTNDWQIGQCPFGDGYYVELGRSLRNILVG
jgi:hypothetical protein